MRNRTLFPSFFYFWAVNCLYEASRCFQKSLTIKIFNSNLTIMKKILTLCAFALLFLNSFAAVKADWATELGGQPEMKALTPEMVKMGVDDFLTLTPKKYKEMTGKRLGIKQAIQLKAAQKMVKKQMGNEPDFSKGLYVLLAILGLAWVAMGVMDDWNGNDWIVNLILTVLCWLPGLIHALTKMKKYYGSSN